MENPFVPVYSELSDEQKALVKLIKDQAFELYKSVCAGHNLSPQQGDARCLAVAKTKLEEAVMWAVKGVTNPPK
ncbi:MAG: hypothetical protein KAS32_21835 [Candidatus Peribacteraceae bacterium]|nr:hypothetical protein [Candidatus Peribacteraceae bacterium]